mmetsp:Transcript_2444/g.7301  ORF Transcript_2444/g.7301 Transcript_2444/m.7301 type:complete len:154 (-) Transcript_2444:229-690(-)
MVPNCGPKFERVLICMEEKHSATACKDVVQDFLKCQREFVRAVVRENYRRSGPNAPPVVPESAVEKVRRLPQPQPAPRRDITAISNINVQEALTKTAKRQARAIRHTWNAMWDPDTHKNYMKFCRRLVKKMGTTCEKAFSNVFGWLSSGRDRS